MKFNGKVPIVKDLAFTGDFIKLIEPYLLKMNGHRDVKNPHNYTVNSK